MKLFFFKLFLGTRRPFCLGRHQSDNTWSITDVIRRKQRLALGPENPLLKVYFSKPLSSFR